MKWNKEAVFIVAAVFAVSYLYSLKTDQEMSNKIKAQTEQTCLQQKQYDCTKIEKYHHGCFIMSYRSQYKARHFFKTEYDACMKKLLSP